MKILKKVTIIVSAIIAVFSVANFSKVQALQACKTISDDKVKYVNATFVDINADNYNAQMRGITKEQYDSKSTQDKASYDRKSMLFGSTEGKMVDGIQNTFVSQGTSINGTGVMQGLVKNKLVNGNLQVVDKYNNGTSLFPNSGATGSSSPYNEILANWKMPFLKEENGYYSFDSDKYHLKRDDSNKRFVLHSGERGGIYPFNQCNDDTLIDGNRNLYFTIKMEIPFLMTTDGKVKNSKTGQYEDMVFNFSGDDDVWVYVDDDLVIDLGGTHIKQTGNVNFATNKVFYSSVYNVANNTDTFNIYKNAFSNGKLSAGKHTLRIFYIERAGGGSNLFASFNLQSSGVQTKYVEKYTNKELASVIKTGAIGEKIELEEKQFTDKVLCQRPEETTATLKEELQTFYFYYKNKYNVITDYLDIMDNSKVAETDKQKVTEDDQYTTNKREVKDYTLVSVPANASGTMPHNDVNVKYYYKFTNAKVIVNYVDKTTGKQMDTVTLTGAEGDIVNSEEKEFQDYVLVEKPGETKFTKKEQTITYYYKHKGKITVNYIDKANGNLLDKVEFNGIEGDKVVSEQKSFNNYIFYSGPEDNNHTIDRVDQEVNYYYVHQSKVTIKHLEKGSNEELAKKEETVTEGMNYETKEEEFENYKLVEKPEKEEFTIGKDDIEVIYYYQKLKFNLKVEMNLKQATINESYHELKNKIGKIEMNIKEANSSSSSKISYIIKVTNDQERIGSGKLIDYIPEGYMAMQEDNPLWTISSDLIYIDINDIKPQETKEYELILTKKDGIDVCGTISNRVRIDAINLEETTLDDNEDVNDLVIMPRTGVKKILAGLGFIVVAISIAFIKLRKFHKSK